MNSLLEKINKFGETTVGKVVIIGITLIVVGVVFFQLKNMLFPSTAQTQQENQNVQVTQNNNQQTTATTQTGGNSVSTSTAQENYYFESGFEVFSSDILRDPFTPFPEEKEETTTTTQTAQTLKPITLLGTTYAEGELQAIVSYDGTVQNLSPGQTIGPFLLVSVSEKSARFLYGDLPVELEVGQTYKP